jgi:cell division protein ZapA
MSDLQIQIGGRSFLVACQPGEEQFLLTAAAMLDAEAQPLVAQMGRLPEARMLLMSALMLADKTASYEDELRVLRAQLATAAAEPPVAAPPAVSAGEISESLAEIAARAEALAQQIEDRAGSGVGA